MCLTLTRLWTILQIQPHRHVGDIALFFHLWLLHIWSQMLRITRTATNPSPGMANSCLLVYLVTPRLSHLKSLISDNKNFKDVAPCPQHRREFVLMCGAVYKNRKIPILKDTLHSRSLRHNCMSHAQHKTIRTVFITTISANGSRQQMLLCKSSQRKMPKQRHEVEGRIFRLYHY